jgi:hypothetical protein
MKIFKFISIIILALSLNAKATIRNVPVQYSSIQTAINASINTDTVLVQPGTYFENINFRGKKIVLTSRFYQSNDYSFIQSTIINGSTPQQPDTASCVVFHNNEDSTTVLQGFTITGGAGTKWADEHGAGLYREGGGVLVAYCNPVIQNNIITGNHCLEGGGVSSTGGGGMRIGDCFCRVYNNLISNNSARYGAGIVLNYSGGEYRNNVIYKNFGSQDYGAGSAMWLNSNYSRPRLIENNTIVSNTAITGIPGILGFSGVQAVIRNNIVWGNTSSSSVLQISGNGLTVRYCDVQGGAAGAGNINEDPSFDTTNYYLKNNSACIDKGDSSIIFSDPSDPGNPANANWPSRGTVRNDLGAYGGPGSKVIANSIVGVQSTGGSATPEDFYLSQNYPNPFNPKTVIRYSISENRYINLKVFNVIGKEVSVLINENQNAGSYEVVWNAVDFPSGIYFYRLTAGEFTETKKMNLIK